MVVHAAAVGVGVRAEVDGEEVHERVDAFGVEHAVGVVLDAVSAHVDRDGQRGEARTEFLALGLDAGRVVVLQVLDPVVVHLREVRLFLAPQRDARPVTARLAFLKGHRQHVVPRGIRPPPDAACLLQRAVLPPGPFAEPALRARVRRRRTRLAAQLHLGDAGHVGHVAEVCLALGRLEGEPQRMPRVHVDVVAVVVVDLAEIGMGLGELLERRPFVHPVAKVVDIEAQPCRLTEVGDAREIDRRAQRCVRTVVLHERKAAVRIERDDRVAEQLRRPQSDRRRLRRAQVASGAHPKERLAAPQEKTVRNRRVRLPEERHRTEPLVLRRHLQRNVHGRRRGRRRIRNHLHLHVAHVQRARFAPAPHVELHRDGVRPVQEAFRHTDRLRMA